MPESNSRKEETKGNFRGAILSLRVAAKGRCRYLSFFFAISLLTFLYRDTVREWFTYLYRSELQQHLLLLPFLSAFLVYRQPTGLRIAFSAPLSGVGRGLAVAGVAFAFVTSLIFNLPAFSGNGSLALRLFSYLGLSLVSCWISVGFSPLRAHFFAIGFLALAVPLPDFVIDRISSFLQHASAETTHAFLFVSRTPFSRDGLSFRFPEFSVNIVEACSGIRSTMILFITSLFAGKMLLNNWKSRLLLVSMVLPIALLRNGFRIALISWLSANVDMRIIEGPLHNRGGPFFFIISLVPLFLWLQLLRTWEPHPSQVSYVK